METSKIKDLLHNYFNGESTVEEERALETYFRSGNVTEELQEYAEFFNGISEITNSIDDSKIEEDVMDFILENEHHEKTKYRWLWQTVTGVAASVIIVLGGFLFYQQQQKPFADTFNDPEVAYAYAQQTLLFVSGKYSKGLAELSNFDKIEKASQPVKKGIAPLVEFYSAIEKMNNNKIQPIEEDLNKNRKSTDSI